VTSTVSQLKLNVFCEAYITSGRPSSRGGMSQKPGWNDRIWGRCGADRLVPNSACYRIESRISQA